MKKENNMGYYLKKHWKINTLAVLLQILCAGLSVLTNLAMIEMTQGLIDLDMQVFVFWITVDLGIWILMLALDGLGNWAIAKAKRAMNNRLRRDMTATLLNMSHQEYHSQQSGEYLSYFSNDINQIENLAWDTFFNVVAVGAQIVFSILALAKLHWSLLAISAVVAVVMYHAPKLMSKRVERMSEAAAQEQALAMAKIKDLLAGLDVLRSFGRTDRIRRESGEASDRAEGAKYRLTCTSTLVQEAVSAINLLCQLAVNLAIGILSIKGIIIQSALMGGGNLCGTIYSGLGTIARYRVSLQASKPYFAHITADEDPTFAHEEGHFARVSCPQAKLDSAIELEGISFSYGEKQVLKNKSLRFEKGGKYALTGPSGCGKSTVLKLLLGWLPDYDGTIRFDSTDIRAMTPEQIQQQMSYIEQNVFLFNTTIRENITLGQKFSHEELQKALRDSALVHDLSAMPDGLDTVVGEEGSRLSGGQKQRVAIARALIHQRSILLVDEGTSALDQKNADIVEKSLLNNPNLTLILVSHHLSDERKRQFDKVYAM